MKNYKKYENQHNFERKRLSNACQISEIEIVRPHTEIAREMNAKASTLWTCSNSLKNEGLVRDDYWM